MSDPNSSPTANYENASVPSPARGYPSEPAGFRPGIPPLGWNHEKRRKGYPLTEWQSFENVSPLVFNLNLWFGVNCKTCCHGCRRCKHRFVAVLVLNLNVLLFAGSPSPTATGCCTSLSQSTGDTACQSGDLHKNTPIYNPRVFLHNGNSYCYGGLWKYNVLEPLPVDSLMHHSVIHILKKTLETDIQ